MKTTIFQADKKKLKTIKELLKAFDVSFKVTKKKEKHYNPEFVKMVLEAKKCENKILLTADYKKDLFKDL